MKYGKTQQGDRKDKAFLRRKENKRKSMESIAKQAHKSRVCKCCKGEHRVQPGTKREERLR